MKRRSFLKLATVAAGGTIFSAAAPTIIRAQGRPKMTMIIAAAPPDPASLEFYFAKANNFYEQEGVDVEFKNFVADVTAARALVAGEGDVAWLGPIVGFDAMVAGAKLKVISSFAPHLEYGIVAKKDVKDLKSLSGRSFAVAALGSFGHTLALLFLEQSGVDPTTVKFVGLGNTAARAKAVIAQQVDAALLTSAFLAPTEKYDYLHQIADVGAGLPNFIYTCEYATVDAVQKKPEALKSFVTAAARAVDWALKNPDDAAEIAHQILPTQPKEELVDMMRRYSKSNFFSRNPTLRREAFDFTYGWFAKTRNVAQPMKYEDLYYSAFADAAVAKLGLSRS